MPPARMAAARTAGIKPPLAASSESAIGVDARDAMDSEDALDADAATGARASALTASPPNSFEIIPLLPLWISRCGAAQQQQPLTIDKRWLAVVFPCALCRSASQVCSAQFNRAKLVDHPRPSVPPSRAATKAQPATTSFTSIPGVSVAVGARPFSVRKRSRWRSE